MSTSTRSRWVRPALRLLVLALAASVLAVPPGTALAQQMLPCDVGGAGSYARVSRAPRYDILPQEVVSIPSELDGVAIQMSIVRPDVPEGTRVPDIFDLLFGGGVPDWRGPSTIITNIYYAESAAFYLPGRSVQSTAEVLACPEYADGNVATGYAGAGSPTSRTSPPAWRTRRCG